VTLLFHDKSFTDLARKATSESTARLLAVELPWQAQRTLVTNIIREPRTYQVKSQRKQSAFDTAFIFHTSGTSTGLPKPIPQSHRAAFAVLPALDGRQSATFTTTPLYHGGIADCFRAWTSRALIWLFPAANIPITTLNVQSCLLIATKASREMSAPKVKYFSSVPYVLQMLADDESGISILQSMELVGVGGAALSPPVGDKLVEAGVNLISRFGSAECGFLLASNRDFKTDREWQYLRPSPISDYLSFEDESESSGLSMLVVKKGWPHLAKTNREDGSFVTGDLFEPHQTISGAWRYHSRSDSQITLSTGKKFDPAPLEDQIASKSPLIREVLVFGTGRHAPGLLIFPSKQALSMTDSDLEEELWEVIRWVNSKGQGHTKLHRDKLVIMPADQPMLTRSAKGTLLRGAVETTFAEKISSAYAKPLSCTDDPTREHIEDCDVKQLIRATVSDVLELDQSLNDDTDFYAYGIDSATCARIRSALQDVCY
jgi:acyl-coenzyme A synthetase/AMP-(fatty) acid ligase